MSRVGVGSIVSFLGTLVFFSLVQQACADNHEEAFRLIEKHDINGLYVVNSRNQYGMPLLNRAAMTDCVECVKVLLENGADIKGTDKNHARTPLHCAAGWSTLEMVQLLVSKGANIKALTSSGDPPLSFARENFYKDKSDERGKITTFLIKRGAK